MNKTAKIILGIAAFTGVVAASAIAIMRAMKEHENGEGKHIGIIGGDDCSTRGRFLDIAKLFNRDIEAVNRRTTDTIHKAKQKKYEDLDWEQEPVTRCDIMN